MKLLSGFLLAKIWLTGYLSKGKAQHFHPKFPIGIYPCFPFNPSLKPSNSEGLLITIDESGNEQ
jgi:hypothetical protein